MPLTTAPRDPAPAQFAIRYGDADIWMNAHGDLGSLTLCKLFSTPIEAAQFLAERRLRAGFRARMSVQPLSAETIRAMSNDAADCLDAARRHGAPLADQLAWRARFAFLSELPGLIEGEYRVVAEARA